MAWFPRLRREKKNATTATGLEALRDALLAQASAKSGIAVNWRTALQATTAQACARVIAEGLAQVPFKLYKARPDRGADPARNHPLYDLLTAKPNAWQTSFEFREQIGLHLALTNNAYVWINRTVGGVYELLPFEPQHVSVTRVGWESKYEILLPEGKLQPVPASDMWHLRGPSWNGWQGIDGIRLMREAIGLSVALEEHGARLFSNGAQPGGLLTTDATLSSDQATALRESWESRYGGGENAYRTAVLWGGMKYMPISSPNDQSQFLETRAFQVEEVCRAMRVMPIMVGHSDKTATYASAEQMFIAHVVHTLGPWYARVEQSADAALLTYAERKQGYYTRHVVNGLLRGATSDRAEYYTKMYGIGALNPNEIRDLEEFNPYDGGDQYRVPLNMADPSDPTQSGNQDAPAKAA